jgi:hypothetical protein
MMTIETNTLSSSSSSSSQRGVLKVRMLDEPIQSPRKATQGLRTTTVPQQTEVSACGPVAHQRCGVSNLVEKVEGGHPHNY